MWFQKVKNNLTGLTCGKHPTYISPTSTPNTNVVVWWTKKITVGFLFFEDHVWCQSTSGIPYRIRVMKPSFVTRHGDANRIFAFESMPLKQLWGNFFFSKFVCRLHQTRKPSGTNSVFLEYSTIYWNSVPYCSPWRHFLKCLLSILSDVIIDFSFVSVCVCICSWRATSTGTIGDVCVPFFHCTIHILTLLTQIQASPYALRSRLCVPDTGFPPERKSYHCMLMKWHFYAGHFFHPACIRNFTTLISFDSRFLNEEMLTHLAACYNH